MFKVGDKWIGKDEKESIVEYERNKELFEGEHWEVFQSDVISRLKLGYQVSEDGYFVNTINGKIVSTGVSAECYFVSENIIGECTDTFTTLMLTDMPEITGTDQEWINEIIKRTRFHDTLVSVANSQSYAGAGYIKTRLEEGKAKIEYIENCYIFPVSYENNKNEIEYILYAYKMKYKTLDEKEQEILVTEEHYKDKIVYVNYYINGDTITAYIKPIEIEGRTLYDTYSEEENTTGRFLITQINNSKAEETQGESDYTDTAISTQREYAVRATQTAISMDKTLNPTMMVPDNLFSVNPLTGKKEANVIGKAIPINEGDKEVKFVEYDGNYDIVMKYQDTLRGSIYREMGVSPIVFDIGNGANIPSGTALKKAMFRTIAETKKKQTQITNGIIDVLQNAYNLETGSDMAEISVKWADAIPLDRLEEAQISQIRTGNKATQSQKNAIMWLDKKTEEQAEETLKDIKSDDFPDMAIDNEIIE